MIPLLVILSVIGLGFFFPGIPGTDKQDRDSRQKDEKWYVIVKHKDTTEIKEFKEIK